MFIVIVFSKLEDEDLALNCTSCSLHFFKAVVTVGGGSSVCVCVYKDNNEMTISIESGTYTKIKTHQRTK